MIGPDALNQVANQQADVCFTYEGCPLPTDPQELAKSRVRIAFELPADSYDVPRVTIGLLRTAAEKQPARQLVSFLGSEQTVAVMVAQGLPDEQGAAGVRAAKAGGRPDLSRAYAVASTGKTGAKVFILAFYPDDEGHAEVRTFLKSFEQRYPGQVEVEIHNFRDPEGEPDGYRLWLQSGLGCAGLFVNAKDTFTVQTEAGPRQVTFQRKMGATWKQSDLETVIAEQVSDQYGASW